MKLQNLAAAIAALEPYEAITAETMGKDMTLARSERLLAHVGNPERKLRVVHVAGTSGKTSTTYYIATLLHAAGKKVGFTVSPHVVSLTERVSIDGEPLDEAKFCTYLGEFLELVKTAPEQPTWFECMIAFTYWVFAKEQVDYAVMETGLGGLQDTTNVAARADKVCVITDVGYDHMDVLGNTLGAIAYQKAGIIHEGNTALMYDQAAEVMQVVRYWVSQQEDAELLTFEQGRLAQAYGGEFVDGLPEYQKRNWLLAFAAYRYTAKRDELKLLSAPQLLETQRVHVPGRMDEQIVQGKHIVFDGAHNAQKMKMFAESYTALYPGQKVPVLLALKKGKELDGIIPELATFASEVIVTNFDHGQDLPDSSLEPEQIATKLQKAGLPATVQPDAATAFRLLLERANDDAVVTGSFFLVSQIQTRLL